MQFAYQYPERTERLVLVGSGGLGPEVTPAIRAITTPGFHQVMGVLSTPGTAARSPRPRCGCCPAAASTQLRDLDEVADIYDSFKDPRTRAAIRHVVRAVVDWKGQIVTMADRAYLTEAMPMCVIWGADDLVIPVEHASNASALAPTARVEIIPNAGHFPHKDHPERFVKIVRDFIRTTEPSQYDRERWRELLDEGAAIGRDRTPRQARRRSPRCTPYGARPGPERALIRT